MSAPNDPDRLAATADVAGTTAEPTPDPAATTADSALTAQPPPPPAGARYALGEEVGHGGMGSVYRAVDSAFGRDVAVKVLHERYGADSSAAQRFADEARITGQLQHPAIPPVHDLGTLPDGRPFLAMKLIRGRTLGELLAERPELGHERGRYVAVFEQVCQALAYAHSHNVIHRDLKPANVMVGNFGEVQVMDWGLAKILPAGGTAPGEADPEPPGAGTPIQSLRDGDGSFTQAGSVLGTPAFMPPEQAAGAAGKAGPRSDVFGLGAVLAVILTGKPPFEGRSAEAARVRSAEGKLGDCFARLDGCGAGADLVALCKRCLAAEPAERPADAREVAAAVAALRQRAEDRARQAELQRVRAEAEAREQRRRRRVQLGLLAALAALLLGGGAAGWWQSQRLGRNVEAASALLDQAEGALRAGDADRAEVAVLAARKRATEGGAGRLAGRLDALGRDLDLLRELDAADRFRWTPEEGKLADAKEAAARYREALGRFGMDPDEEGAAPAAARADGSAVRPRVLAALDHVLRASKSAAVREVLRALDDDPFRNDVRDALRAGDDARVKGLAAQQEALAQPPGFTAFLGEDEAVPLQRRRLLLMTAAARLPGELGLLMALARSYPVGTREGADERLRWCQAAAAAAPANPAAHNVLGIVLRDRKDLPGAEAALREAIRLDPRYARARHNLGSVLYDRKDLPGAEAAYREAIRLDPTLAPAHGNLGGVLRARGDLPGAEAEYRAAIHLDPTLASGHAGLGNVLHDRKDLPGAEAEHREAIRLAPKDAYNHDRLGSVLRDRKDLPGAEAALREAIRLDPSFATPHDRLGLVLFDRKDLPGAEAAHKEAIRLDPTLVTAHSNLGGVLRARGGLPGAEAAYRAAIRLDPKHANAHAGLGHVLSDRKDLPGAEPALRQALRLDPRSAFAHNGLGSVLYHKGDLPGAEAEYRAAIRLDPTLVSAHSNLGSVLYGRGDQRGAEAAYREAIRLDPSFANAHTNLGVVLRDRGDLAGAAASFKEALRLDPSLAALRAALPGIERMRDLQPRLAAVLADQEKPKTPAEACDFAQLCARPFQKRFAAATRLYEGAFADDPRLPGALSTSQTHRYSAACFAARAARGDGIDSPTGTDDRAVLRGKALGWLRADVAVRRRQAASADPAERAAAAVRLAHWLADSDFSGVRDPRALEALPGEERKLWREFWSTVSAALAEARRPPPPPQRLPPPDIEGP